jgi:hypothetical protein
MHGSGDSIKLAPVQQENLKKLKQGYKVLWKDLN